MRGNHPAAARRSTGADLRTALSDIAPPDDDFSRNITAALAMVEPDMPDPWSEA